MKQPVPILFLSDAPDLPTGLSRISRDLAIAELKRFFALVKLVEFERQEEVRDVRQG